MIGRADPSDYDASRDSLRTGWGTRESAAETFASRSQPRRR